MGGEWTTLLRSRRIAWSVLRLSKKFNSSWAARGGMVVFASFRLCCWWPSIAGGSHGSGGGSHVGL